MTNPIESKTVSSWQEANAEVKALAASLGIANVTYGTGYPIKTKHLLACTMDAWSGEGMGYNVTYYPEGDTYGAKRFFGSIRIK